MTNRFCVKLTSMVLAPAAGEQRQPLDAWGRQDASVPSEAGKVLVFDRLC
jgi:hypothetical protein